MSEFTRAWAQPMPAPVSALALTPEGNLAVGFRSEVEGVVAREYARTDKGLDKRRDLVRGLKEIATQSLSSFTQLKVHEGNLYFGAYGKLMRLAPGKTDQAQVAFDPGWGRQFDAFGFAPNGDLYLAAHYIGASRGVNLYRCVKTLEGWAAPEYLNGGKSLSGEAWYIAPSDLEVDAQGRVVLRLNNPEKIDNGREITICRWSPDGSREKVFSVGADFEQYGSYGLHLASDGKLYVAGGTSRSVSCLAPTGELLWRSGYEVHQGPNSVPWRQPMGITTDRRGRVWITEPARNQVICLAPDGKFLKAYGHFGSIDGRDGMAFCNPAGIAAIKDAAGVEWLYVADAGNQRLVKWRLP